jgi:hypothetical protein
MFTAEEEQGRAFRHQRRRSIGKIA